MRYASILTGSVVVAGFMGCFSAQDLPSPFAGTSAMVGTGGSGMGGFGGTGTAGGGMGGGGGQENPCAGCIGTGGGGGAGGCVPFETSCSSIVTTGICNDQETCVDHCSDGVKDGDETDVDCGGLTCAAKCAQKLGCAVNNDCDSMPPDNELFCTDGVCCNNKCNVSCFACDLPGAVGTCKAIPDGMADSAQSICNIGEVCETGVCSTKTANGEPCQLNGDCASSQCEYDGGGGSGGVMKVCKQANGTPCADGSVCASGNCTSNICLP